MAQIEAVRVAQDAAYAASLSDSDWYALSIDPAWQEMVAEQSELVAGVIAKYGNKIPGATGGSTPRPRSPRTSSSRSSARTSPASRATASSPTPVSTPRTCVSPACSS